MGKAEEHKIVELMQDKFKRANPPIRLSRGFIERSIMPCIVVVHHQFADMLDRVKKQSGAVWLFEEDVYKIGLFVCKGEFRADLILLRTTQKETEMIDVWVKSIQQEEV